MDVDDGSSRSSYGGYSSELIRLSQKYDDAEAGTSAYDRSRSRSQSQHSPPPPASRRAEPRETNADESNESNESDEPIHRLQTDLPTGICSRIHRDMKVDTLSDAWGFMWNDILKCGATGELQGNLFQRIAEVDQCISEFVQDEHGQQISRVDGLAYEDACDAHEIIHHTRHFVDRMLACRDLVTDVKLNIPLPMGIAEGEDDEEVARAEDEEAMVVRLTRRPVRTVADMYEVGNPNLTETSGYRSMMYFILQRMHVRQYRKVGARCYCKKYVGGRFVYFYEAGISLEDFVYQEIDHRSIYTQWKHTMLMQDVVTRVVNAIASNKYDSQAREVDDSDYMISFRNGVYFLDLRVFRSYEQLDALQHEARSSSDAKDEATAIAEEAAATTSAKEARKAANKAAEEATKAAGSSRDGGAEQAAEEKATEADSNAKRAEERAREAGEARLCAQLIHRVTAMRTSRQYVDVDYQEGSDDTSALDEVFRVQEITGDALDMCYAMLGRALLPPEDTWQVGIVMQGISKTGKSTLLDVLQALYASHHVGTIQNHCEKFLLSDLRDKKICICSEVRADFNMGADCWQSWVTRESQEVTRKHMSALTETMGGHVVLCGNEWPGWNDVEGAILRRAFCIQFEHAIGEPDPMLFHMRIRPVLGAILHKCLCKYNEYVQRAKDGGNIVDLFAAEPTLKRFREALEDATNGVTNFVRNSNAFTYGLAENQTVSVLEFKKKMRTWIQENSSNEADVDDDHIIKTLQVRFGVGCRKDGELSLIGCDLHATG